MLIAGLFCFAMLSATAQGHGHHAGPAPDAVAGATAPAEPRPEQPHEGCMMHGMVPTVDFQSVKICFAPQMGAFIAIDSIECSVHLVKMVGEKLDTVGSYQTDNIYKRHDLKNILRPISVGAMGKYVVVLASAVNDTAYVALLDQEMNVVARRDFRSPMYAMHFEHGQSSSSVATPSATTSTSSRCTAAWRTSPTARPSASTTASSSRARRSSTPTPSALDWQPWLLLWCSSP